METAILVMLFGALVLALYFLPTVFAVARDHRNKLAIFAANLLLGWSGIVWIILIIWSLTKNVEPKQMG